MNDPKALLNRSQKICKHFIEAVETKKYGWFWVCPNGGNNCQYRHAMPEDYVPKSEKKEEKPKIKKTKSKKKLIVLDYAVQEKKEEKKEDGGAKKKKKRQENRGKWKKE